MNSLVKVFSNFREFYSEINGATLTGAIDVIVVEQPDGEFHCSPFHVRFGKLGVLRSREKVVDIEINGEVVDIQMKLGDSGEAFFVEECSEDDDEELPENLATSPIPINKHFKEKYLNNTKSCNNQHNDNNYNNYENNIFNRSTNHNDREKNTHDEIQLPLPKPRRNSIDTSHKMLNERLHEKSSKFENEISDYSNRRHTDNTLIDRRNISEKVKEYTTQKLRQEWAEHEELFQFDKDYTDKDWINRTQNQEARTDDITQQQQQQQPQAQQQSQVITDDIDNLQETLKNVPMTTVNGLQINEDDEYEAEKEMSTATSARTSTTIDSNKCYVKQEAKNKKKRRKRSQMKKKYAQRQSSTSSSSVGGNTSLKCSKAETTAKTVTVTKTEAKSETTCTMQDNKLLWIGNNDVDTNSTSVSTNTTHSSNDEASPKSNEQPSAPLITATVGDDSFIADTCQTSPRTPNIHTNNNNCHRIDLDIHFFSDTEITSPGGGSCGMGIVGLGRCAGRSTTPIQSDSELELSQREKDTDNDLLANSASWKWGELPTPEPKERRGAEKTQAQRNSMLSNMFNFMKKTNMLRKQVNEGGMYLSDLNVSSVAPDVIDLYFPKSSKKPIKSQSSNIATAATMTIPVASVDDDAESGNGTSLPHSRSSLEGQKDVDSDYEDDKPSPDNKYLDFIAMSLCGLPEKGDPSDGDFEQHLVKYQNVCENPSLFASPNLVVRLNGKYYSWTAACPIVMTIIAFQKPLTDHAIEQLMSNSKKEFAVPSTQATNKSEVDANTSLNVPNNGKRSWWYWRRSQQPNAKSNEDDNISHKAHENKSVDEKAEQTAAAATQTTRSNSPDITENTLSKTDSIMRAQNTSALMDNIDDLSLTTTKSIDIDESSSSVNANKRMKKSLRLSSEAIKQLNLKEGMNEIEFSVTTAYQGTTRCKCYLFRWKYNDKIVISDIDGTITKSDVLGHILPMVGKDWAQLGVAQLFSKIEENGYKLLYLSARAIGQARATREYLRSIRQGNVQLPDGPLLLNPTSLMSALHREVIERKPEQFKIACLSDIKELFPNRDPFYAGYGNRINDVWAYRAVGIPIKRIFTINTKGELKHELTQTFQSSYCGMAFIADQLFPPIRPDDVAAIEFSHFNYWRDPLPQLDYSLIIKSSTPIYGIEGGNNITKKALQITETPEETAAAAAATVADIIATATEANDKIQSNMNNINANTNHNNDNAITNDNDNNNDDIDNDDNNYNHVKCNDNNYNNANSNDASNTIHIIDHINNYNSIETNNSTFNKALATIPEN